MTVFRNVMVYLGLGPDEEYEDGYLQEDNEAVVDERPRTGPPTRSSSIWKFRLSRP